MSNTSRQRQRRIRREKRCEKIGRQNPDPITIKPMAKKRFGLLAFRGMAFLLLAMIAVAAMAWMYWPITVLVHLDTLPLPAACGEAHLSRLAAGKAELSLLRGLRVHGVSLDLGRFTLAADRADFSLSWFSLKGWQPRISAIRLQGLRITPASLPGPSGRGLAPSEPGDDLAEAMQAIAGLAGHAGPCLKPVAGWLQSPEVIAREVSVRLGSGKPDLRFDEMRASAGMTTAAGFRLEGAGKRASFGNLRADSFEFDVRVTADQIRVKSFEARAFGGDVKGQASWTRQSRSGVKAKIQFQALDLAAIPIPAKAGNASWQGRCEGTFQLSSQAPLPLGSESETGSDDAALVALLSAFSGAGKLACRDVSAKGFAFQRGFLVRKVLPMMNEMRFDDLHAGAVQLHRRSLRLGTFEAKGSPVSVDGQGHFDYEAGADLLLRARLEKTLVASLGTLGRNALRYEAGTPYVGCTLQGGWSDQQLGITGATMKQAVLSGLRKLFH